ncbi:hypothetical protein CR513_25771, partial [Mucuna pruriens]
MDEKRYLSTYFYNEDLREIKYYLRIKYRLDIISKVGLLGEKLTLSPMKQNHHLEMARGATMKNSKSLIYLTITWPELSYCVHVLAQFMQHSKKITGRQLHEWYIIFRENPGQEDKKKKHTVSQSYVEAKYRSMVTTIYELKWIKGLFASLGIYYTNPISSTFHIVANPIFHERTKHIEVDCLFVRDEAI